MKVLSINIRHGGGSRIQYLTRYIRDANADVVVVSELRENSNAVALRQAMLERGLSFFAAAGISAKQNSVGIFSRAPFVPRTYPELGPEHAQRILSAHFSDLSVYGVYFPQLRAKAEVFDFFLAGAPCNESGAVLVVGDFNTGSHKIDEAGATFYCADKFGAMSACTYVDCWRSRNQTNREFTWFSTAGNGFRIDHAFANPAADARVRCIYYDHTPRESAITDHSALFVEISGR